MMGIKVRVIIWFTRYWYPNFTYLSFTELEKSGKLGGIFFFLVEEKKKMGEIERSENWVREREMSSMILGGKRKEVGI